MHSNVLIAHLLTYDVSDSVNSILSGAVSGNRNEIENNNNNKAEH